MLCAATIARSRCRMRSKVAASRTASRLSLEITFVADRELTPSTVRQYENVGVHRLVVVPASMLDTSTETLVEHIGSTLIR